MPRRSPSVSGAAADSGKTEWQRRLVIWWVYTKTIFFIVAGWVAIGLVIWAVDKVTDGGAHRVWVAIRPDIKREVNLSDLATILLTVFLAWYVPYRIDRRLNTRRYELEVLIRHLESLQQRCEAIHQLTVMHQSGDDEPFYRTVLHGFNDAASALALVEALVKLMDLQLLLPRHAELVVTLRRFKRAVTGGSFGQTTQPFAYSDTQRNTIRERYYTLFLKTSELIIHINRG